MSQPSISIILACFNEERCIARSIRSILTQTFIDWELIIIDDGSSDRTAEIIESLAREDQRITLYRCGINIGLASCLNIGIFLAKADLIARMDADDVSLPDRLEKQHAFLRNNPEIDVLGTGAYLIDSDRNRVGTVSLPRSHSELAELSFLKTHFFHPSVMIRRRFFEKTGVYNPVCVRLQDKDIWIRGLKAGAKYANLPDHLIEYSANEYKSNWRTIFVRYKCALGLVRRQKVKLGILKVHISLARSILIKCNIYRSQSIRIR